MDYSPVGFDDEDELRRQHGYAPAIVGSSPLTAGVDANPYPAPSPVDSEPAATSPYPAPKPASDASSALTDSLGALKEYQALGTQEPQRTTYKEKPLGTGRKIGLGFLSFLAGMGNPQAGYKAMREGLDEPRTEQDRLYNQAHTDWQNKMNVSGNRVKLGEEIAKTQHDLNPPKDKEESWEIAKDYTGPNGEPLETEKNSGQMRIVGSQQPIDPKTAKRYEKPDNNEHEKQLSNWLAANKLPDTPANREKAEDALAKRAPQAHVSVEGAGGNWMPTYDDKGHVTGAWNPKTGQIQKAPANMEGTTAQGINQQHQESVATRQEVAAHDKAYVQPAEAVEKSYQMMEQAYQEYEAARAEGKDLPTGAQSMLALSTHLSTTFGNVKGARITKDMIAHHLGARSISDSALVAVQKLTNGDVLSPDQWNAFHELIGESRKLSWQIAEKEAKRKNIPVDFMPNDLKQQSSGGPGAEQPTEIFAVNPKTKERKVSRDGGKTWLPAQ